MRRTGRVEAGRTSIRRYIIRREAQQATASTGGISLKCSRHARREVLNRTPRGDCLTEGGPSRPRGAERDGTVEIGRVPVNRIDRHFHLRTGPAQPYGSIRSELVTSTSKCG